METDPNQIADGDAPLTGHAYDGIQEYDNPLPGWWKWLFIGTIFFSLLYWPFYHFGAPGRSVSERYDVALGENMRLQFAEIGELQPNAATLVKMMNDSGWVKVGESVYRSNCASCHGIDGGGIVGPNLTDDHYKNVREVADILKVVQQGAAAGAMPAWKSRLQLNEQILVSSYVASLRGSTPSSPKGAEGNVIPPWPTEIIEEPAAVEEIVGEAAVNDQATTGSSEPGASK
jgi:cytochrome c oxidase cbb3-type subunit III